MKLLFKQRMFSWFDSYDIFDEQGNTVFTVKGVLAWGHCLKIFDTYGREIGCVKEEVFSFLPRFRMYIGGNYVGQIKKELTFLKPRFVLDCNGWEVNGDFWQWEYEVTGGARNIMRASKQLWNWTDTYQLDIYDPQDALICLMIVLAIDAVKCSSD